MTDREKVMRGIEHCLLRSKERVHCGDCPYWYDDFESGCHVYDMMRDALALLKEQEPRVMTLEKIQSGTVEVAWLECSDKEEVRAGLWFKRINEGEDEGIIIHVLDGFEGLRTEVYGKTWRCWSARPTEEQMRETPWEGDSDAE